MGIDFFPCSIYHTLYLQCYWNAYGNPYFPKSHQTHFTFFLYKKVHLNPLNLYINPLKSKKRVSTTMPSWFHPFFYFVGHINILLPPSVLLSPGVGFAVRRLLHGWRAAPWKMQRRFPGANRRRHDLTSLVDEMVGFLGGGTSNIFYFHPEIWGRWTHFD